MENIKIRVWTGKELLYYVHNIKIPHYYEGLGEFLQQYCACDFELCSGLKDRCGKDIYDGDVFVYGIYRANVVFKNGAFGYMIINRFVAFAEQYDLKDFLSNVEVIGNIHEIKE